MIINQLGVQILGKNFSFNVPDSINSQEFQEIVDYVENKINRIRKEAGDMDGFRLGLLASINIAEEFFALKKENEKLRAVFEKIDSLLPPLDQMDQLSIRFST